MMQSFQCASRNMTTAKVKIKSKDLAEAEKYLKMELQQFPDNDEAKVLLAETLFMQGKSVEAIEHITKIRGTIKDPRMLSQYNQLTSTIWVNAYNSGIAFYNKYLQSNGQNKQFLDTAIQNFDLGSVIKPQMVDFHMFKGLLWEMDGDTAKAMDEYSTYMSKLQGEIQFARNNGLFINMSSTDAEKSLGAPVKSDGARTPSGDSILVQTYKKGTDEAFMHFMGKPDQSLNLKGWRINLPDTWTQNEKMQMFKFDIGPAINTAQYEYSRGNKEKALQNIKLIADLDPNNEQVNSFLLALYQEMDKTDEAMKSIDDLIKKDPKNPMYFTKYGDLYTRLGFSSKDLSNDQKIDYFTKAIEKYNKALEIDPNYEFAVRNIASAYKNLASVYQSIEYDKYQADDTYEIKTETYEPNLKKSAEYFTRALEFEKWRNDYAVMNELADINVVLGNDTELKQILRRLESLEYSFTNDADKLDYYYKLVKIYGLVKDTEKMKAVQTKIENLSK